MVSWRCAIGDSDSGKIGDFLGQKTGKRHEKFMGNQHVLWRFHGRYNPKSEINKFMMILYQLILIYNQHEPIWHHWGVPENGAYWYIQKKTFNGDKPWDFRVTYFRQTHLNFVSTRGCWWALAPILGTLWWINVLDSQFVGPLCQLLSKHVQKPTGAVRNLVGARCHIHAVASLYPFTSGWYI